MDRTSLHIRLPRELHELLKARADEHGTTLNDLVLTLLAGAVGFDLTGVDPDAEEWG